MNINTNRQNTEEAIKDMNANRECYEMAYKEMAKATRQQFLAYKQEGFNDEQALRLVIGPSREY